MTEAAAAQPLAVLIDFYDTLAYSQWPWLKRQLAERLSVTPQDISRAMTATRPIRSVGTFPDVEGDTANWIEALGIEPSPALVAELVQLEADSMRVGVHLYEDSLPAVHDLRSRGVKTALVSNCSHSTRPVVDRLDLESAFDVVVLSFEVRSAKPDAPIYHETLGRLGLPADDADRCLFVDDQAWFCDGAAALGMQTRLIIREDADPAEGVSTQTGGHPVITDLTTLL